MLWLLAIYLGFSIITFAAYGIDKAAAKSGSRRISEATLLWLGLLGGWPGGLLAQRVFRHKTAKRSFLGRFWATIAFNIALVGLIVLRLHVH